MPGNKSAVSLNRFSQMADFIVSDMNRSVPQPFIG
jgi:hypothetical protein